MNSENSRGWRYEYTVILINWFIFGFCMIDRLTIANLFPWVLPDLKMNYTEAGLIMSVIGLVWGACSLLFGGISDRIGRKIIIVPATFIFSLLSWMSGLARNFAALISIRGVMAVAEGAYFPTGLATVAEESAPERRGRNVGIFESAVAVFGFIVSPIYAVAVATTLGWRWALYLTIIPGIILALLFWRFVREPAVVAERLKAKKEGRVEGRKTAAVADKWWHIFRYHNVRIGAIICIFVMAQSFLFLDFGMLFLTRARAVPAGEAGLVMSVFGIGALIGYIFFSWLSDQIGRKITLVLLGLITGIAILYLAYGAHSMASITISLFVMGLGEGLFPIVNGPVPFEAVPGSLSATAVGLIIFVGELVGSALIPAVGGRLADLWGIQVPMIAAGFCAILVALLSLLLKETAPKVVARKAPDSSLAA